MTQENENPAMDGDAQQDNAPPLHSSFPPPENDGDALVKGGKYPPPPGNEGDTLDRGP